MNANKCLLRTDGEVWEGGHRKNDALPTPGTKQMAGCAPLHSGHESEPLGERLHRFQINADISAILPVNFQQVVLAVFVPVTPLARSWALAAVWPSFLRSRVVINMSSKCLCSGS